MGYWEQTDEQSNRWRERRMLLPWWRRIDLPLIPMIGLAAAYWGSLLYGAMRAL